MVKKMFLVYFDGVMASVKPVEVDVDFGGVMTGKANGKFFISSLKDSVVESGDGSAFVLSESEATAKSIFSAYIVEKRQKAERKVRMFDSVIASLCDE